MCIIIYLYRIRDISTFFVSIYLYRLLYVGVRKNSQMYSFVLCLYRQKGDYVRVMLLQLSQCIWLYLRSNMSFWKSYFTYSTTPWPTPPLHMLLNHALYSWNPTILMTNSCITILISVSVWMNRSLRDSPDVQCHGR